MMKAKDVTAAADLLIDREEITEKLSEIRAAKRCEISIEKKMSYGSIVFANAKTLDITPAIRKLLTSGLEENLAEIDRKLEELGVEPPKETEAA